jgi:hypothetical protein
MKRIVPLALLGSCLLLAGCGSRTDVVVTDHAGSPVAGAKVQPLAFSISDRAKITNKKGRVSVPWTTEKVKWLNVSARGFKRSAVIFTGGKEQTVVLQRPSESLPQEPPPMELPSDRHEEGLDVPPL